MIRKERRGCEDWRDEGVGVEVEEAWVWRLERHGCGERIGVGGKITEGMIV